ncbi:ribonuclease H2 subunit B [Musca domestica]|uniref:Ribonuclease H2 subunit B n=1 Tax=Musca domestica TaxID=7370 RepID=A0A1I8MQW0_MUSDO|nr:ribonuclease H2 subunit B [Musca domestica]
MSKGKSTRSTKIKEDPDAPATKKSSNVAATALRKIFYISQQMLTDDTQKLKLERFYHPGKGKATLFMTKDDKHIMEIMEFSEPRRSWLINREVCSNGHIYMTTSLDATFLALHHLRKHCAKRALSLDSIHDEEDPTASRLLNNFIPPDNLKCIADVKTAGGDKYFKYNHEKCLAWLSLKTKRMAEALKKAGIYCGHSAVSQNFTQSEKAVDESAHETDYLRVACDYIGGYLALDLHDELTKHLNIPSEIQAIAEEKKANNTTTKRKSGEKLKNEGNKKQKLANGAAAKLKNSNLLDDSKDDDDEEEENRNKTNEVKEEIKSPKETLSTPLKERPLSAKEKSLAKSAKGTKSIASFFTKKAPA